MTFGSIPPNTASYTPGNEDYVNTNRIRQFSDSLTWVKSGHTVKAGIYIERNRKLQPGDISYTGNYSFGQNNSNPLDSGNGYSNALLGNFSQYSEKTGHFVYDVYYWNIEWYRAGRLEDHQAVDSELRRPVLQRHTPDRQEHGICVLRSQQVFAFRGASHLRAVLHRRREPLQRQYPGG